MVLTFPGPVSDAQFQTYLDRMSALLDRGERYALVMDATRAGTTPAVQHKMQAEWIEETRSELERRSLGTAFVITSGLVRGILTAILWLTDMPGDHIVVGSRAEAERWARGKLRDAGLE